MEITSKYKKITLIIVSIFLFILATYSFFPTIKVESDPTNTQFVLNDKVYTTPFELKVMPGNHLISTHLSEYKDFKEEIRVRPFQNIKNYIKLEKLSTEDAVEKEEKRWTNYFEKESNSTESTIAKIKSDNPLTEYLPYITESFIFDYYSKSGAITYFLKTHDSSRDMIIIRAWIKAKGINPDNINIGIVSP